MAITDPNQISGNSQTVEADADLRIAAAKRRAQQAAEVKQSMLTSLQDRALNNNNTVNEAKTNQAQDQSLSQQLAARNASRSRNPAAQDRQMGRQAASVQNQIQNQAAQSQVAEQAQAQSQLLQADAANQQQLDSMTIKYIQLGLGAEQAKQRAILDLERIASGERAGVLNQQSADAATQTRNQAALFGNIVNTGAKLGGAYLEDTSDANSKKDIEKSKSSFASKLASKVPDAKGFAAILASQAQLNEKLNSMEAQTKKKKDKK